MNGIPGWSQDAFSVGWYQDNTEGIATLRFALEEEGIVTVSTDDPANVLFSAKIQNPESISGGAHAPIIWPHGDTSGTQGAAESRFRVTDVDGDLTFLIGADLRDSPIICQLVDARAFGTATMMRDAPVMATFVLDDIEGGTDYIEFVMKDPIALLDAPLPIAFNPPFIDPSSANRMRPLLLGSIHNAEPQLEDKASLLYRMGDAPMSNVTAVKDGGGPLDPNADDPQYLPALDGAGFTLDADAIHKLTFDASSVGVQAIIPGADDLLDDVGDFSTWTSGVPDGWDFSAHTGSLLLEVGTAQGFHFDHMVEMLSARTWYPPGGQYGDWLILETDRLEGGVAYRLTVEIYSTQAPLVSGLDTQMGGIQIRSALSNLAEDAISPHSLPLQVAQSGDYRYAFEFRCPPGADRPIYIIASTSRIGPSPLGAGGGIVRVVKLERLGSYIELPQVGINLKTFLQEWLQVRAGKSGAIFDHASVEALDERGYEIGYYVTEQPNMLEGMHTAADNWLSTFFTNYLGVMFFATLIDPKDGTPIAVFDSTNTEHDLQILADDPSMLTTVIGTTRNESPFDGNADFLSDFDIVPQDVRNRYEQTSQYQRTSSKDLAGQYSYAIGASVYHSNLAKPEMGQDLIDRTCSLWAQRVYDDATSTTGKRRRVKFVATWDEITKLGTSVQCDVRDIYYGKVVTINRPDRGLVMVDVTIMEWEPFIFGQRIAMTGFF